MVISFPLGAWRGRTRGGVGIEDLKRCAGFRFLKTVVVKNEVFLKAFALVITGRGHRSGLPRLCRISAGGDFGIGVKLGRGGLEGSYTNTFLQSERMPRFKKRSFGGSVRGVLIMRWK